MGFKRTLLSPLPVLAALLGATLVLLGWLSRYPGFYANKLLLVVIAGGWVWLLWRQINRTNRLLAGFVAAIGQGDLTQGYVPRDGGGAHAQLGRELDEALGRLRHERDSQAVQSRHDAALVEATPVPLLVVDAGSLVFAVNRAARTLFGLEGEYPIERFAMFGTPFTNILTASEPRQRQVCAISLNGIEQCALVGTSRLTLPGDTSRLVSVQIIQNELDATELTTQVDLIRILTHEIMNSMTPITSLAASTARMMETMDAGDSIAIADARLAAATVARRAEAITRFVHTYRQFSETPSLVRSEFSIGPWLHDLIRIFREMPEASRVEIRLNFADSGTTLLADSALLGQVVLNLLKNAAQAVSNNPAPLITVSLEGSTAERMQLRVADNGPGIAPELRRKIFLPFFTTRIEGSGIGLHLARQIVHLHGGTIAIADAEIGGAELIIFI
ncbi:MAG: ATP-binding protein [Rhodanobacter sp.]